MTTRDTVIIAVDASKQSEEALEWYCKHVHQEGNKVILAHGCEFPSMPTRDTWDAQHKAGQAKCKELQDKFSALLQEKGLSGQFTGDFEKPGEFVVEMAKKEKATYVVIGTRGMGKIRRTVLGSVSDYVVHHAPCPVLVCRKD